MPSSEAPSSSKLHATVDAYTRSLDCIHCGLCLPACPTHQVLGLESDSPRGRIYLMRALAEGRIEDPEEIRPHLDQCLDCRACETVCPSGVQYGEVLETVRSEMAKGTPDRRFGARVRRFLLSRLVARQGRLRWAFRFGRLAQITGLQRLAFALRLVPKGMRTMAPAIPPARERAPLVGTFTPEGTSRGEVWLFTGCVMEQLFGHINRLTRDLLVDNGFTVHVPKDQGCCGALLIHNGQSDAARPLARNNLRAFRDAPVIINNSAGCGAALKEYPHLLGEAGLGSPSQCAAPPGATENPELAEQAADFASRCRDISEFLGEHGLTSTPDQLHKKVAYEDPCHLCHAQGIRKQPRDLLRAVPGLELLDQPDADGCCGSAGIYNINHPELAGEIGRRKAEALQDSGAEIVATGNPGCMMQLQAHLGPDIPVMHPVELLRSSSVNPPQA